MEDVEPAFSHHPVSTLPLIETPSGASLRIVAGEAFGRRSPVTTHWPTLYVDAGLPEGSSFELQAEHEERALYVASGSIGVSGGAGPARDVLALQMAVLEPGVTAQVLAHENSRVMLLGGRPFATPRQLYWNFVASTRERLDGAKQDWAAQNHARFPKVPGDDVEFIPLPG
jgi:redox-sensitive bicupin YhaK (pirin superfamily)